MSNERKDHWERVYTTKTAQEVSWTQEKPETALALVQGFRLDKSAPIIDIGGGDSRFADHLLEAGYDNITVLDISEAALQRARERLGAKAASVNWIRADITSFEPGTVYELWHDRATFHFLTQKEDIDRYSNRVARHVSHYMILGTFSDKGPEKCSNLPVARYDAVQINSIFQVHFDQVYHKTEAHRTPFGTVQDFLFTAYKKTKHT